MNLGFIGLGIMGESMALNLVKKSGEKVFVFDFISEKVTQLEKEGAVGCADSKEVVKNSDVVFISVPKAEHVKVIFDTVYDVVAPHQIFIDMSTISPNDSIKFAKELKVKGSHLLDAPVVKSKKDAIEGTLGIYVGGDPDIYHKVKLYLECIGSCILYMGQNGSGLVMKVCHNMLVGEIQNGVNELLCLANKNGIGVEKFAEAISMGGAHNRYLETKAKAIGSLDFTTAFSIENMHKDVNIAKEMIQGGGMNLPGAELVLDVYQKAMDKGYGKEDFSASFKVVSESNI